jgi:ferric-dicitrate binding protein FerR (iron transport regulator)
MSGKSAQELLRELRRVVVPAPDAEVEHGRRERIAARVLALSMDLRARERRRARARILLAAIVSLGAVLLVVRFGPWRQDEASARIVSGQVGLREGNDLRLWTEPMIDLAREPVLETGPGELVALELPSRAAVEVAATSELSLSRRRADGGMRERIQLRAGGVKLRVPKLAPDQRLAVETADATVEVRGTRFGVRVERDARGAFTSVEVEEGRVAVSSARGPALLGAGERWTSREPITAAPTAREPAPSDSNAAAERELARVKKRQAAERVSEPEPASAAAASELADQNRLLQGAALARRSGLPRLALERLETLLERYPTSELAHNARVEHFRLLRDTAQLELAQRSARAYLARYPNGFAAVEAKSVLALEEAR